jgi:membrane fusion protein (multidrug efflux system)
VRAVHVGDYQQVHKGDLIVELEDDDYRAQVDQASAAVAAARAAIENNRRQRELQDSRIDKALAGIDEANAQIAAAEAGKKAVEAELVHARSERKRQEDLYQAHSTTQQKLEAAVANERGLSAQFASRDADLTQARSMLQSTEIGAESRAPHQSRPRIAGHAAAGRSARKQASLEAAMVNLGYTKIYAPAMGTVGERQVRPDNLFHPAHRSSRLSMSRSGCRPTIAKPS